MENTTIGGTAPKGNLTETIDYIPGSMILGALRKVLKDINLKDINNEQKDSNNNQDYLDDKNVVVSPFYPTSLEGDDIIVFPTPLSLRRIKSSDIYKGIDKSVPHWVYKKETSDTLSEIVNKCSLIIDNNKNRDDTKDKSFSGGYIVCKTKDFNTTSISQATYYAPRKILSMRNSIDSEKQTTKDNSLFLQEQIVKGTKFVGGITFKDKEMAKEFLADFGMFFSNTDKNLKLHLGLVGNL